MMRTRLWLTAALVVEGASLSVSLQNAAAVVAILTAICLAGLWLARVLVKIGQTQEKIDNMDKRLTDHYADDERRFEEIKEGVGGIASSVDVALAKLVATGTGRRISARDHHDDSNDERDR